MASEGQFPKIDGDVLYAKDYNATNKLFAAGLLKTLFSLNGSFNAVKPTLTAVAAGTNNMAVQSGSVYTTYANDSSYNGVMDNFNTFDTAKWSSGVGAGAITIDNGFLVVKGDTQNGSTWIKSTGNIFGMAGGNIRLRLGSLVGGNEFYPRISIDDVPIYNGAITNPNYSGATIDIMRMSGSNYYYRFEPYDNNNTFIGWSGLPTASNGILEINIIYGPPGGGGNATGSFFIDFVNYVSGISPNSFRVSGTINTRFEDNLPPSQIYPLIDGGANYLSGIDPSVSFNGGSNFSAVSNGSWTVVANSGTSYVFDWVQSGTYGSGLCGGNVLKSIAFMYD